MLESVTGGILAGLAISLGGSVFLAAESRVAGAVLFSVALLCICMRGYNLFTGRVGFLPVKHGKEDISSLLLGLLGNLIATVLCGYLVNVALPALGENAASICRTKLSQTFVQTLLRGCFCGILMYLAVSIYREKNTVLGILFCIPVFILSGFEHSIADLFYFSVSGIVSLKACGFIWTVILGNALGAVLVCLLEKVGKRREAKG